MKHRKSTILSHWWCLFLVAASNRLTVVKAQIPTNSPTIKYRPAEYDPGNLNVYEKEMWLSKGLEIRLIATAGEPVVYGNGTKSPIDFHYDPDGAAVFADERPDTNNPGGWVYVSNSEDEPGGVGAIYFDADGNIIEYKMLLTGTVWNCNGGKTDWDTWISCEEDGTDGRAWQVHPFGEFEPVAITHGSQGGAWESFAHDTRDPSKLYAFLTEDVEDGALQRQTIHNPDYSNPWEILLGQGTVDYLFLEPDFCFLCTSKTGKFQWIDDEDEARENAYDEYPSTEGMEMIGDDLILISKALEGFFRLDLDAGTYTFESTDFAGQPDQSTTVKQDDGTSLMYFTQEAHPVLGFFGQQVGIWTRNQVGEYVNILFGDEYSSGKRFALDIGRSYCAMKTCL